MLDLIVSSTPALRRHGARLALAAGLALAFAPVPGRAQDKVQTGTAAYPDNPSGTPQTENKGAPVVTDKAACSSATKCPDKPGVSAAADSGSTSDTAKAGGIRTPATAYPDSPVATPATDPSGTAPKP